MKEYKLTDGTATVYQGKDEIEPVIKMFIKDEGKLKKILNQWCLKHNCICDLCILFKNAKTNLYLAIFKNKWKNALGLTELYSLNYGSDYIPPMGSLNFCNLINEFFQKNEEFILPYQKSFLKKVENYNRIFVPLLTKNNDLINAEILRKYFWFSGDTLECYIDIDGVGSKILHYNEVTKKHFIYVDWRDTIVQVFFDKKTATDYTLNILTNRLNGKKREIENLEERINKIKNID